MPAKGHTDRRGGRRRPGHHGGAGRGRGPAIPTPVSVFYRQRPGWRFPTAVRAEGVYIWDESGRRLIDAAGGALVVGVGHGVREIADAIGEQARRLP